MVFMAFLGKETWKSSAAAVEQWQIFSSGKLQLAGDKLFLGESNDRRSPKIVFF